MKEKKATDKEHLEIIEKKVDIKKKRVEIEREKLHIDEIARRNIAIDEEKILVNKITEMKSLLSGWTIDEERTILASEPFFKSILSEQERK